MLEQRVVELQKQLNDTHSDRHQLSSYHGSLQSINVMIKQKLTEFENQNRELISKNRSLRAECDAALMKQEELDVQISTLNEALSNASDTSAQFRALNIKHAALVLNHEKLTEQHDELSTAHSFLSQQLDSTKTHATHALSESFSQQLSQLENQLQEHARKLVRSEEKLQRAQEKGEEYLRGMTEAHSKSQIVEHERSLLAGRYEVSFSRPSLYI